MAEPDRQGPPEVVRVVEAGHQPLAGGVVKVQRAHRFLPKLAT